MVTRCLAKDPDQRFQTAIDLKAALAWAVEPTPHVKPPRRWWIAAAAALALGLAGGWKFFQLRQPARDERAIHFQIPPPKGVRSAFEPMPLLSISPDGRYVTFKATVNGRQGVWLHPLDGSAERVLTNNETARLPFWSPDSRYVGWWADGKLWRVNVTGGLPIMICDAPPRGAAWTEDGGILFGSSQGVWQVPASGGSPALLTTVDRSLGETQHGKPVLLPKGRFLTWVQNAKPGNSAIYAVSLSKPSQRVRLVNSEHEVKFAPAPDGRNYLLLMRDQTLVAQEFDIDKLRLLGEPHTLADRIGTPGEPYGLIFAEVSRGGILLYSSMSNSGRFLWLDRAGKPLVTLTEPSLHTGFRLSPDGRRMVLARGDLWILDERQVLSRFTSSPEVSRFPVWSPDGQTIVFGRNGLYRKDVRGSGEEQILGEHASAVGRKLDHGSVANGLVTRRTLHPFPG